MRLSRKFLTDLTVGGLLSIIFGGLLARQIMAGGVGTSITFTEFLSTPANLLFCMLMCMFILAAWLIKGINNRTVVFFWAVLVMLHLLIFYSLYSYFLHEFKNIYVLCCVGLASTVPSVLLLRYRVGLTLLISKMLWKAGFFKKPLSIYLSRAGSTDFELDMCLALYAAFCTEFLYSLYLVCYGLINRIPYHGNITEHMLQNDSWTPYSLYFSLLDIVGIFYILIIGLHLFRSNKEPDSFGFGMTEAERKIAGLRLLEKSRKIAHKSEQNHKRDP